MKLQGLQHPTCKDVEWGSHEGRANADLQSVSLADPHADIVTVCTCSLCL